jgi:hypothetical protein
MHYVLKHKMLQFVFIYLYMAPTCFDPSRPSSGSIYRNLTKVTVSLKHQLLHAAQHPMHTLQTETFIATAQQHFTDVF